jgi:hypothetical protein
MRHDYARRRLPVIVREILRTCSNPHVARAAVASIGGDFAQRVSRDAAKRNLSSGLFAASLVRRFSRRAGERDWEGVGEATRGADQPILSGLRYILEHGVELDESAADSEVGWLAAAPLASCRQALRN